ncbi:hypothetical protein J5X84_12630 [Streptosporangiaceae bacterium NEAU-GS5]|nr:hypothetical protein [Streptosporangiaceae bacterium NEAU-GS5]
MRARSGMVALTLGAALIVPVAGAAQAADSGWSHATAWGFNDAGQVGDGSTTTRLTPVPVTDPGLGFTTVAAGSYHSLGIAADGTLWAWGANNQGQLGDGGTTSAPRPRRVPGLTNVTKIAAGADYSLAVLSDGSLWAWGLNDEGQLGDGTIVNRSTPVRVPGLASVIDVATGSSHTLAVLADGTVRTWGGNLFGELGDGTTTGRLSPVLVPGLTSVTKVAGGYHHSLALRSDGSLWSWGDFSLGALGRTGNSLLAAPVPMPLSVVGMAAGGEHTLAVTSDGRAWSWGRNDFSVLGDGGPSRGTPALIPGLANVIQVSAGGRTCMALLSDHTIMGWGNNQLGNLGDGTDTPRPTPVPIRGVTGVTQVSVGLETRFHTAAHTVVVRPAPLPAFSIAISPEKVSLPVGGTVTLTVATTAINGSLQRIGLSPKLILPAGVTATFNPQSVVAGGTSTLTLRASVTARPSPVQSTVTVIGSSALPRGTASATFQLRVTPPLA